MQPTTFSENEATSKRRLSSCDLKRKTILPGWLFRGAAIIRTRGQSKIMQRPSLKEFRRIFFFLPADGVVNRQNTLFPAIRKLLLVISKWKMGKWSIERRKKKSPCRAPRNLLYVFCGSKIRHLGWSLALIHWSPISPTQKGILDTSCTSKKAQDLNTDGSKDHFPESLYVIDPVETSIQSCHCWGWSCDFHCQY